MRSLFGGQSASVGGMDKEHAERAGEGALPWGAVEGQAVREWRTSEARSN